MEWVEQARLALDTVVEQISPQVGWEAVAILRLVLRETLTLCQLSDAMEEREAAVLENNANSQRLRQIPGIGAIAALTILAAAIPVASGRHLGLDFASTSREPKTALAVALRSESPEEQLTPNLARRATAAFGRQ
jgi:transposase